MATPGAKTVTLSITHNVNPIVCGGCGIYAYPEAEIVEDQNDMWRLKILEREPPGWTWMWMSSYGNMGKRVCPACCSRLADSWWDGKAPERNHPAQQFVGRRTPNGG